MVICTFFPKLQLNLSFEKVKMIQFLAFWSFRSSLNGVRKDCVTSFGEKQLLSNLIGPQHISYKISVHDDSYLGPARGNEQELRLIFCREVNGITKC